MGKKKSAWHRKEVCMTTKTKLACLGNYIINQRSSQEVNMASGDNHKFSHTNLAFRRLTTTNLLLKEINKGSMFQVWHKPSRGRKICGTCCSDVIKPRLHFYWQPAKFYVLWKPCEPPEWHNHALRFLFFITRPEKLLRLQAKCMEIFSSFHF